MVYGEHADYGLMKTCSDFPNCDSYCGHGATLANRELRDLRKKCHRLFDEKWKSGAMSRKEAYYWLIKVMKMSAKKAHISQFRDEECKKLLNLLTPSL